MRNIHVTDKSKMLTGAILGIALIVLPILQPGQYVLRVLTMIGIYIILALSLNLVTGYMGQISMGHAAFYAIGAYVSALLSIKFGLNFFVTALVGTITAGLAGALLGIPTMRLSGTYLAITTLGFAEVVKMICLNWESVTRGALGLSNIPRPKFFGFELTTANGGLYYLMLACVLIVTLICLAIVNSKMGRVLKAIKNDELAATLVGIKTNGYKVLTFAISAAIAGFAGAFFAHSTRYIDPNSFTFDTSMLILSIVILGGMGTLRGMFVGAIVLVAFPEVFRFMAEYRFIVYGLIMVIMMRFRPSGIQGGLSTKPYRFPKGVELKGGETDVTT